MTEEFDDEYTGSDENGGRYLKIGMVNQSIEKLIDFQTSVTQNVFDGKFSITNKFGRNPDTDTATVPEDVWNGGGVYTGFPTNPDELQVVSASASDTGVLTFAYLASSSSTAWQQASVTLNGTTPVNTGVPVWRMHTARYNSGSATEFNVGEITARHRNDNNVVFSKMPIGTSQTYVAAYTVPAGSTGVIKRIFAELIGQSGANAQCALWVRVNGNGPRLRRPFTVTVGNVYVDEIYGGVVLEAGANVVVRMTSVSANNMTLTAGFDLLLIRND